MVWDVVEMEFGGDETGNFGPRQESGSALYQVDTMATISPRDQVTSNPCVVSCSCEGLLCVAVENQLSVFGDGCRDYIVTRAFESPIDAVACTSDGNFIAIAERTGSVKFIYTPSQSVILSKVLQIDLKDTELGTFKSKTKLRELSACQAKNEVVEEDGLIEAALIDCEDQKEGEKMCLSLIFTPADEKGCCHLIVTLHTGEVALLTNLHTAALHTALQSRDLANAKELQSQLQYHVLKSSNRHSDGLNWTCPLDAKHLVTGGCGDSALCLWKLNGDKFDVMQDSTSILPNSAGLIKGVLCPGGEFLLALHDTHTLSLWSVPGMVMLRVWPQLQVQDFYLLDAGDDVTCSLEKIKIVLLMKPELNDLVCNLQICRLPSLAATYCIELNANTSLVMGDTAQEGIFVVEGILEDGNTGADMNLISTLRIRCLTETQPETRLLLKKRFDEAKSFAAMFGLNMETLHKARSMHLLDQLSPWNSHILDSNVITQLLADLHTCLRNVKDDAHVAECCVKVALPTFEDTLSLVKFAADRLNKSVVDPKLPDNDKNIRKQQLTKILETQHRLGTYKVAVCERDFRFSIHAYPKFLMLNSAKHWEKFQHTNLLHAVLHNLEKGQLYTAFTIWNRHQVEFEEKLSTDLLEDILAVIPEQAPSVELKDWLANDFIPFTMRKLPEGLGLVAGWIEQKARDMEIYEKTGWPQNSLAFCELLHDTCVSAQGISERGLTTPQDFSVQECNLSVGFSQTSDNQNSVVEEDEPLLQLHKLTQQLRDLSRLHTKYNCRLSLDQYLQETVESLTYRMLDRVVAAELVPTAIEKIVRPYMKEHSLTEDRLLYQYIGDLAKRSGNVVSYLGDSMWEAKAIAIINCIKDPEFQCRAILDAMKGAYVPWSVEMDALVSEGLALNHHRVCEIEEVKRLIRVKEVLINYGLGSHNVMDVSSAQMLVYFVLKKDRDTALNDALLITHAYKQLTEKDTYSFYLNLLVEQGRLDEAAKLLRQLEHPLAISCTKSLKIMAEAKLDHTILLDKQETSRILFCKAACESLKYILTLKLSNSDRHEFEHALEVFQNISVLQCEFGEFVQCCEYSDATTRKELLDQYVQHHLQGNTTLLKKLCIKEFNEKRRHQKNNYFGLTQLLRLAEVLQFSREELQVRLVEIALQNNSLQVAVHHAKELSKFHSSSPSACTSQVLYQVGRSVSKVLATPAPAEQAPLCDDRSELTHIMRDCAHAAGIHCSPASLCDCLELCRLADMAMSVLRSCDRGDYGTSLKGRSSDQDLTKRDPYSEWTFSALFVEDGLVMDFDQASCLVHGYAQACLPFQDEQHKPYQEDRIQGLEKNPLTKMGQRALLTVQHLRENSQMELALHFSVETLAKALQYGAASGEQDDKIDTDRQKQLASEQAIVQSMVQMGDKTISELQTALLHKALAQNQLDHDYALGLMISMPSNTALHCLKLNIKNAAQQYKKVESLAKLGIDFAILRKEKKVEDSCHRLRTDAYWGNKLAKLKISFKSAFNTHGQSKLKMVRYLVESEHIDILTIQEYCSTYELDENHVMLEYLRALLLGQTGECNTTDAPPILHRARSAVAKVTNNEMLCETLHQVISKMDPYDYDKINFVLHCLDRRDGSQQVTKGLQLLKFLSNYVRVSTPSAYELALSVKEVSEEDQMVRGETQLPALAKTCLPFQPFYNGESWKIISPELTEATANRWLPIVALLNLSQDQVFLTAIANIVNAHVKVHGVEAKSKVGDRGTVDKSKCNWQEDGVNQDLFKDIKHLLLSVSNFENAIMCANWIIRELPMGAEKVLALRCSIHLAQKWIDTCTETQEEEKQKAQSAHSKFAVIYRRLSVEQALYKNKLGTPDLLELAPKPAQLIKQLYEHPSILQRSQHGVMVDTLPDIHSVAEEIGALYQLNVSKIRQNLLEKLLPSTSVDRAADESNMSFNLSSIQSLDMTMSTDEEVIEEEDNLKRLFYLLQQGSLQHNVQRVYTYSMQQTNQNSAECRVRALRCLFSLVDGQSIVKFSSEPIHTFRQLMMSLLYLIEMEKLHMPQSLANFQNCSKEGLVRGIWRNHKHEKKAVRLIVDMCLDFKIVDVQLWNSILQQLMAFQMMTVLQHVLVRLSGIPQLWHVTCIQNMWHNVLLSPLTQATPPLSASQQQECLRSYCLLYRCPLLLNMDLLMFAAQFERVDLPLCAAGCLLLVPQLATREQRLSEVLGNGRDVAALKMLSTWTAAGRIVPFMEPVRDLLYEKFDHENRYEDAITTGHLTSLTQYLIDKDHITGLLLYALAQKRLRQAINLLDCYGKCHPSAPYTQQVAESGLQGTQKIALFLELSGYSAEAAKYLPDSGGSTVITSPTGTDLTNFSFNLK